MQTMQRAIDTTEHHPLDVVERTVGLYKWHTERNCDTEISARVPGKWSDFNLYFTWNAAAEAMQITCAFDMRIRTEQRGAVHELLMRANESLWLGHFTIWLDEGLPMFRHSLPLRGAEAPTIGQIQDMIDTAIYECERFYPAFQYVIWGGHSASDAMDMALLETVGEA